MAKDVKKTNKKIEEKKDLTKEVKKKEIKKDVKDNTTKDKLVVKKKSSENIANTLKKVDNNRVAIILFIVGFLIATLLFRCILWPDRIATLKDGTQAVVNIDGKNITANDLYEELKGNSSSINLLINMIDNKILTEKYEDSDDIDEYAKNLAEKYYSMYAQSGYSKDEVISGLGFTSEKDFLETLKLDYRREMYVDEYALSSITEKEINNYYEDDVFGDVDSKHILVSIDSEDEDGLTDSEALELAKEIIKKLDDGKTWDEVVSEYKDKITTEDLGYMAFNASLESAYLEECKNLEVGKYSKTPVLTSYGYHIVYKIDQKEKPKLDDVLDDIKEILADEKKEQDTNYTYKSLIHLREEYKLEFIDTVLKEEYNNYINQYK